MKEEFSKNKKDRIPKAINFEGIRSYIIKLLEDNLDNKLYYHSVKHTLNVEEAVLTYARAENISEKETVLLRTAALFHDSGYIDQYKKNEPFAAERIAKEAPKYGFEKNDIMFMSKLILATARTYQPTNLFEQILCDADHDYLGREEYHEFAQLLCDELNVFTEKITEKQWLVKQINYLEIEHQYYTRSAQNLRQKGKDIKIKELKESLALLNFKK